MEFTSCWCSIKYSPPEIYTHLLYSTIEYAPGGQFTPVEYGPPVISQLLASYHINIVIDSLLLVNDHFKLAEDFVVLESVSP